MTSERTNDVKERRMNKFLLQEKNLFRMKAGVNGSKENMWKLFLRNCFKFREAKIEGSDLTAGVGIMVEMGWDACG